MALYLPNMNWRVGGFVLVGLLALFPSVVAAQGVPTEPLVELTLLERVAIETSVVMFMGVAILGLFPSWGSPAIETARGSTFVSGLFGVLVAIALLLLGASAWIFSQVMLGWLAAYPLALLVLGTTFIARAIGFIALGNAIIARFGVDHNWVGLVVGVAIAAVLALLPMVGTAFGLLLTVVGLGGMTRTALGSGKRTEREQSMPPAHRL